MSLLTASVEEIINPPESIDLFLQIKDLDHPFFLDSANEGGRIGRYSFLGAEPFLVMRAKNGHIELIYRDGRIETVAGNPFDVVRGLLDRYRCISDTHIPFVSGGVGFFSYDLKDIIEDLPSLSYDDLQIPDCMIGFYDSIVAYDHMSGKAYLASLGTGQSGESLSRMRLHLQKARNNSSDRQRIPDLLARSGAEQAVLRSNFSREEYYRVIDRAKEYIEKGDIYQVNLSQRFETDINISPSELYLCLRRASPAPFSSYLGFGDISIASSSPERFLMKRGDYLETRPIKGTMPRSQASALDTANYRALLSSAKDMAEHLMIVDLERNDLGRVSRYGSVRVEEFMLLERFSHVFHLVSTVSGALKEGVSAVDCLVAAFPGGSITGAPKIRAMEIIEELESVKRSVYTGAIGYLSFDGNMDTSVVIRTFLIKGHKAYFQVGGGIVADSDPEKEYDETLHKAAGLCEALGCKADIEERCANETLA